MPIVITRANNIFGTRQFDEKVIPKFMKQMLECKPITIHGNGKVVRNFLHVSSFCEAYDKVIHHGKIHEVYNIGTDFEISIIDLASKMKFYMRHEPVLFNKLTKAQQEWLDQGDDTVIVNVDDRIFNDTRYALNINKISQLGWKDECDFDLLLIDTMLQYIIEYKNQNA